jgi:hypothetical protein
MIIKQYKGLFIISILLTVIFKKIEQLKSITETQQ